MLFAKSAERQARIRDSFYEVYYQIRTDLYDAISKASRALEPVPQRQQFLEATRRLLDRLLFIYYCEDHPQQLIQKRTLETVTHAATQLPGPSGTRVYDYLKFLFSENRQGQPAVQRLQGGGIQR